MIKFKKNPNHNPNSLYNSIQLINLKQRPKQKNKKITSNKIYKNYSIYLSLYTTKKPKTTPKTKK